MENTQNQQEELEVDFWDEVEVKDDSPSEIEDKEETSNQVSENETTESSEEDSTELSEESQETVSESEEESEEETEEEDLSVVESIRRSLGYDFDEEFEDSEEGIQKLVNSASDKKAEEALQAYFEQFPDVQELLEYRMLGGDPDKFFETRFPEVDYKEVELKEDNEAQQEQLIRQELQQVRGYSREEADAEIEDYKNGGILENKAKRALQALRTKQQADQRDLLEQQREQQRLQQEEVENYWNTVQQTLDSQTSLKGFNLPTSEKQKFFDYLARPVENGMSQAMINAQQADLETRLAIDYLLYKGFNLSDLVDRRAKTQVSKTLKERLSKSKLSRQGNSNRSRDYTEELGSL